MSRLFTSSSKQFSWQRIVIDIAAVFLLLLGLEAIVRIPPIHEYLSSKLDSYENLLWYDGIPPRYVNDLKGQPDYTLWLLGSSYMMTSIEPLEIQERVSSSLNRPITAQNFGLTSTTNLSVLADYYERVLLPINQPQYMVLFIGAGNFSNPNSAEALNGTYEQVFVFPDSLSDYAGAWIYSHSDLYRYLILGRNAMIIPYEQTLREPRERGGYTERTKILDCQLAPDNFLEYSETRGAIGRKNLLAFIEMAKRNNIPLLIINLPLPDCTIRQRFTDFETYKQLHLLPTAKLLEAQGIEFYELDLRFNETIEAQDQFLYFDDSIHANIRGSVLFSEWTAEIISKWLSSSPEAS